MSRADPSSYSQIKAAGATPPATFSAAYGFDRVGNITGKTTEAGANVYGYDRLYQLISATIPTLPQEAYGYDKVGNRKTSAQTEGTWSHNKNNELLSYNGTVLTYDANGNTVTKSEKGATITYSYGANDRLTSVQLPDGRTATYKYDPFGRRVSKHVGTQTTYFLYADEGLIGEYGANGSFSKGYGWRPNGIWGTAPVFMVENGGYYFYHNDHLGTPQKMTSVDGDVVWSATYGAFGNATVDPASSVTSNLRLPGQYLDGESGLNYNWNRYYDPQKGSYMSQDPLGFEGAINLFSYSGNNPILFADPWGLRLISPTEGDLILRVAKSYEGVPYLDGGGQRSSRQRADCSGVVWLIYNEAGFNTEYYPSPQFPKNSKFKPSPNNVPQSGDVGWWNGHVLIYDGNAGVLKTGQRVNAWSARNNKHPFGRVSTKWWSDVKGPVKWYRYDKDDSEPVQVVPKGTQKRGCAKCEAPDPSIVDPTSYFNIPRILQ